MANMKRYLKINGRYHYENCESSHTSIMDEVAICFDKDSHLLLDHGDPEEVIEYYEDALRGFKEAKWTTAIGDIIMIVAKFPVRELNKLMLDEHYLTKFIENNKELFARDMQENG